MCSNFVFLTSFFHFFIIHVVLPLMQKLFTDFNQIRTSCALCSNLNDRKSLTFVDERNFIY